MRRALIAATLGGLLLSGAAACSDDKKSASDSAATAGATSSDTAPTSAAPDYSADTKKVCADVDKVFDSELEAFGTQVGKMIAYKEAKQTADADKAEKAASAKLKEIGEEVRTLTGKAQDPQLKEAGDSSADRFLETSSDNAWFDKIKTTKDLEKVIDTQMSEWLTPVTGYCA
jgi:hypothetical protein